MNIPALKAELIAGHPDTGAYDADDTVAAAQINAVNRSILVVLTMQEVREWAGVNARGFNILSGISNEAITDQQRNVCYIADKLIGTDDGQLDPGNSLHVTMINALVTAGVISSDDRTALADKATRTVSRATELSLGRVGVGNVAQARS